MKHCFFIISCTLALVANTAYAEGLPANPWSAKQEIIDNTIFHASRNDIVRSNPAPSTNSGQNTIGLKDITSSFRNSWEQNKQQHIQTTTDNNDVNTIDALNALNTLSRYMNNNHNNNNNADTTDTTGNSMDFSALKQKFSNISNQSKAKVSAQNSETDRQIRKLKYKYNYYKSEVNSGYDSIKNKTKPIYDTMKKSVQEAEKISGVKF